SGSTILPRVVLRTYMASANGGTPLLLIALVMIAAGLGFKVAAVPFHFWAPDTYEGAPAPAAAFIASVSKVASFALLISIGYATLHYLQSLIQISRATCQGYSAASVTAVSGPQHVAVAVGMYYGWFLILVVLSAASM